MKTKIKSENEFRIEYIAIINNIENGYILYDKKDNTYFVHSNSINGGKSYNSKFFDTLLKAEKYIYLKTKHMKPLTLLNCIQ
jgi:hypothetical protein